VITLTIEKDFAMKSLNECITEYRNQIAKGEIRIAYRGLIDFMIRLRNTIRDNYPSWPAAGNLYQGYMDMTYFPLSTDKLKDKKLKIAVVLIHDTLRFEIWLSAVNKNIQSEYWDKLKGKDLKGYRMPSVLKGSDSIIEHTLENNPDFGDPDSLIRQLVTGTVRFINDVEVLISEI